MPRVLRTPFAVGLVVLLAALPGLAQESSPKPINVSGISLDPAQVTLDGPDARFQLLVNGHNAAGNLIDLTHEATYSAANAEVVSVSPGGSLFARTDGQTEIEVAYGTHRVLLSVVVHNSTQPRALNFENDVIPILSKYGCNASGCHGKAEGQNGFKLSIFGFDPEADMASLTQEGRGRRVSPAIPEESLLLLKAAGGMPHGGGVRIRKGSGEYRLLREWVAAGMPFGEPDDPRVVSIEVSPGERLMEMNAKQQLRVLATYSDGRQRDVTHHAKFQTNNESLGAVNQYGLVTTEDLPGEVAIMASYMGAVDIFRVLIPRPASPKEQFAQRPVNNFIDKHVDSKLRKLNISPSELCTDAEFVRRAYLDVIGTLPTAEETRTFLSRQEKDRRARLIDELLKRSEFADYWALKWSDLLRVDRLALGHKGAYSYYAWIRSSFSENKPYDEFVRELLTSEGELKLHPSGNLYKVLPKPGDLANAVSQTLLGVRIECAQCHHHPFDRWSQRDYYGMEAFFTQVTFKSGSGGDFFGAFRDSKTKHPRSGEEIYAHALAEEMPPEPPEGDRRRLFADWLTSPNNPWFAQNFVNRTWAHFTGRGLIEPVDDVRLTNPPTNPELLKALSDHFIASGYDVQELIRTITSSRTYQLSSKPNATNAKDEQNYSRALFKKMDAEVLFDAVCQTTGVMEKFDGLPSGYRAIQLWDSQVKHYFLKLFGRPVRVTSCDCERAAEPSVAQVLHVLNSPEIHGKLTHDGGRIARLVQKLSDDSHLVEELYLTFYNRLPSDEEAKVAIDYLQSAPNRRLGAEDLAWSMMNTVEFLFNR